MSGGGAKVLFDASSCPGYEETRKKHLRTVNLITVQGMAGTPLILIFVWVMLEVVVYSGIDAALLGAVFLALIIFDELVVYCVARPMLLRGWKSPTRITEEGVERSDRLFRFNEIEKLMRFDFYLMVQYARIGAKVPILNAQLGDVDEFISVFRRQAPGIEFKDMR